MRPKMRPMTQIVAVAENGVIGRDQTLPWHLPSDLKRFKALTMGKPMLMGRKTFTSIGRPLPGRISVVVSSDPAFTPPEGVRVGRTLEETCALADAAADEMGADEIMVIGGRGVFAGTLALAQRIHLTQVHATPEGDVRLPPFDPTVWRESDREGPLQGPGDELPFSYVTLDRI